MRDPAAIKAFAKTLSKLDVLVNGAGIARPDAEFEDETYMEVMDVNLNSQMRFAMAVLPLLKASKGVILNTASMLSYVSDPAVPAYGASKSGVLGLTRHLAHAFGPDGIRVNAISPGYHKTDMTKGLWTDPVPAEKIAQRSALKRWGTVDDLVGTALFLASPAAVFITGADLPGRWRLRGRRLLKHQKRNPGFWPGFRFRFAVRKPPRPPAKCVGGEDGGFYLLHAHRSTGGMRDVAFDGGLRDPAHLTGTFSVMFRSASVVGRPRVRQKRSVSSISLCGRFSSTRQTEHAESDLLAVQEAMDFRQHGQRVMDAVRGGDAAILEAETGEKRVCLDDILDGLRNDAGFRRKLGLHRLLHDHRMAFRAMAMAAAGGRVAAGM